MNYESDYESGIYAFVKEKAYVFPFKMDAEYLADFDFKFNTFICLIRMNVG